MSQSNVYKDIDNAVFRNDFERGLEEIRSGQDRARPIYTEKNVVSLFLDKGLLEHYAGNYRNSSQDLQEAERFIEEAFTRSITAGIASYILNDNTKEYPGEDYEDIYINVFNALNYYHNNDLEGAMVEIRKITMSSGKLDMLSRKYDEPGKSAEQWAEGQLNEMGFENAPAPPQRNQVNFTNSALARYLGALFYLGQGNTDEARIEFGQLHAAFRNNPNVYYHSVPKSVAAAQNVPEGKARLNVICFAGLSPIKEEKIYNQFFPFFRNPYLQFVQLKLPVFQKRPSSIDSIEVDVHRYGKFQLELLEDIGAVVEETYNARFTNIFLKTYIRTMLKYAAADIAATEAGKKAESNLAALAASVLAKQTANISEAADIRMGRYFPGKVYIGGINLDPGTYSARVTFYEKGNIVAQENFRDINIRANELNLIEATSLR